MSADSERNKIIAEALDRINNKQQPTIVDITERVKRKYWI